MVNDDAEDGKATLLDAEASPLSVLRTELGRLEVSLANARSADRDAIKLKIEDARKEIAKLTDTKTDTKTDGEMMMDALSTLRGRVEVAAARK